MIVFWVWSGRINKPTLSKIFILDVAAITGMNESDRAVIGAVEDETQINNQTEMQAKKSQKQKQQVSPKKFPYFFPERTMSENLSQANINQTYKKWKPKDKV